MKTVTLLLFLILSCCTSNPGEHKQVIDIAMPVLRTVGDAFLRVEGYATLKKYAPEALEMIDTDLNKVVTLAEVEAVASMIAANPEAAAGLLAAAYIMRRQQ